VTARPLSSARVLKVPVSENSVLGVFLKLAASWTRASDSDLTRATREERTLMVTHFNPTREPVSLEQPASPEPAFVRAYRISDVCKATGLGRTSIYAAIKAGDLVARKYKRCTIVLHDDLATFLHTLPKVS
jgi:hypothetical protein